MTLNVSRRTTLDLHLQLLHDLHSARQVVATPSLAGSGSHRQLIAQRGCQGRQAILMPIFANATTHFCP